MIEIFPNGDGLTRRTYNNYYTYVLTFKYDRDEKEKEYIIHNHMWGGKIFTTHCMGDGSWWSEQGRTIKELIDRIYNRYSLVKDLKIIQINDRETYNKWKLAEKLKK